LAVNAKFQADFTSFQQAVQKAEVSLRSFETGAGKVESALNKMTNGFSGVKVIQDANLAAEAIERIGGASKLTVREQEKVNASVTEALAKYKALGIEAPKAMVDLANATAKVPEKLSLVEKAGNAVKSTFGQVFSAFTAANLVDRAVTSFINLGKAAISAAGDTLDLANKTGLSTDTIQRMGFVATQTGTSVDAFTNAAFMLGVNLEKGKGQVEGLGRSFAELRALRPDQQFEEVVRHLEEMEDPQVRNEIAVRLFGKAAKEVLPAIAEGYSNIASKATVAKNEQLKAVDEMSDKWDGFVKNMGTRLTSWAGREVDAIEKMGKLTGQQTIRLDELKRSGLSTYQALDKIFPKDVNLEFDASVTAARLSTEELEDAAKATAAATKKAAEAYKELQKAAVEVVDKGIKKEIAATRELLMAQIQLYPQMHAFIEQHRTDLLLIPPSMDRWAVANEATTATLHSMVDAGMRLPAVTQKQIDGFLKVTEKTTTWKNELEKLSAAMTDLAQVAGSGFVSGMATIVNSINVGTKAVQSLKTGFGDLTSGKGLTSILSGFTGIVSGIGGIVSAAQAAIQIGKALFGVFDRDKGRDLVEKFAGEFSDGFNEINKYMGMLGEEGVRMWAKLTQGGDTHSNPDAARKIIDEVRAAIEKLKAEAATPVTVYVNHIDTYETQNRGGNGSGGVESNDGGGEYLGFAGGTKGKYLDFGSGTNVTLHGRERVMTEAEGRGDGTPIDIHVHSYIDGKQVAESVATYVRRL
jgi:hypothetical protein